VDHHDGGHYDGCCEEHHEELKPDPETLVQTLDPQQMRLVPEVCEAQGVFILEMLLLDLQQRRLGAQERGGVPGNLRVLFGGNGRNRGRKSFRTGERLGGLYFRFIVLPSDNVTEQALSRRRSPSVSTSSRMVAV
jgi:hypothetical protein